jgi:hypothetical protein
METNMTTEIFDPKKFDISKFDSILTRGLSTGLGQVGGQVCIEAAICETLGLGHSDDPKCVAPSVRAFKIKLNDSNWPSPAARAKGLRDLGIAQLGSLGVVDDIEFVKRLAEKTIRVLIPKLFRKVFANEPACLKAADECESTGTGRAAYAAERAAYAAYAAYAVDAVDVAAADVAGYAAYAAYAADAAYAARYAARAAGDEYLILSAQIALEVLRELKSPGVELL